VKRHFLLLQGVSSPFFKRLGETLLAQGHRVTKVSFNGGDVAYWAPHSSRWFRQNLNELPDYLNQIYRIEGITDQVLFGDRRALHQIALQQAQAVGIRNHVFEEGYFRPYWVTLEREGVNSRSQLPKDPQWLRKAGRQLSADNTQRAKINMFQSPFWYRAAHDVAYHFASAFNPFVFPKYRTHAPVLAPVEYVGFVRREIKNKLNFEQERTKLEALLGQSTAFYFVPLQLNSDFQVKDQDVLNSMPVFLEHVIASFARHAPERTHLVIKNHPLDIGQIAYQSLIDRLARQYDVSGRINYFETGDLQRMLKRALGTITLNSTVGSVSLELACPALCLAEALYNLPGLTAQCQLDDFWTQLPKPDPDLFQQFKTVVMHTTQVNGGFYCPTGIALAARGSAEILTADTSPLEQLMQQVAT